MNEPFDFYTWERAQSQKRWLQSILLPLRERSLVKRIWAPLLLCISVSIGLDIYNQFLRTMLNLGPAITLPPELFSLTSASLGLLLVFRTNGAYGRYDEARKIWGDTLNRT